MTKSVEQVREEMDARFAAGTAYQTSLPFDLMRGDQIRATTLRLSQPEASNPDASILDVGCGQGGIQTFFPCQNIVGIDISPVAVKQALVNIPAGTFYACAIENLPEAGFVARPFDLVVAQESIEHWTDARAGLRALRQVLKPKGALVMTTPNRDSLHCRMARKLGFEAPICSNDHIHEYGFTELVHFIEDAGFHREASAGVHLAPCWALEAYVGHAYRQLTDNDVEVNTWLNKIGAACPEFAFIQAHRFIRED